jgi:glycosyltransferase involved in cell wall biosynthesis
LILWRQSPLKLTETSDHLNIAVIIPVHNGGESFARCLRGVLSFYPTPSEVIIVADGDTDGSAQLAHSLGLKVLRNERPLGPAAARNRGARESGSSILLFLDADVEPYPDLIGRVQKTFTENPAIAALFGSYDASPAAFPFFSQYKNLQHHFVHQRGKEEASTFWTGCGAIRREVFLKMEGFDEQYRIPAMEDIDLGYRLHKKGYRIRLEKSIQVKHLKVWSFILLVKVDFFRRAIPWTELILRERIFNNDLNLDFSSRLSVGLSFLLLAGIGAAPLDWRLLIISSMVGIIILGLNFPFYRFLKKTRGSWFVIRAVPVHWFYFLYCGAAFGIGLLKHWWNCSPFATRKKGPI